MNQTHHPNWNLLRSDPVAFFGLPAQFDRKELKRSYNALIRVYKPEKHPAEFQKIRAAFELLDGRCRYGNLLSPSTRQEFDWAAAFQMPAVGSDSGNVAAPAKPPAPTISHQLLSETAESVYKNLNAKADKSPFDYYALALLSDVVAADRTHFFRWLLAGLKHHPAESGLLALLHEYFQTELPLESLQGILTTTSKVITNDRFFMLTEKLWHQLLRQGSFGVFRATLDACEKNLKTHHVHGQMVFYLNLLGTAIWKASEDWIDKKFQFIEEHAGDLPHSVEDDLELVSRLRTYQDGLPQLLQGNPIREQIHGAIVQYFSLPDRQAEQAVINCQTSLANNARAILEAFPLTSDEKADAMLVLWGWINEEVFQRNELFTPIAQNQVLASIHRLLQDLDEGSPIGQSLILKYYFIRFGTYVLAVLAPWLLLGSYLTQPIFALLGIALSVGAVLLLHFKWNPKQMFETFLDRSMRRTYETKWRSRFVQLFEANPINHEQMSAALYHVIRRADQSLSLIRWVINFVPTDTGLAFYALAARYKR